MCREGGSGWDGWRCHEEESEDLWLVRVETAEARRSAAAGGGVDRGATGDGERHSGGEHGVRVCGCVRDVGFRLRHCRFTGTRKFG